MIVLLSIKLHFFMFVKTSLYSWEFYGSYHRPFIIKAINYVFYCFIFEMQYILSFYICELLEIMASIINGFALLMKEEHKLFLMRALILLHKPKCVLAYHQSLSYCVAQFVENDGRL